MCEDEDGIWNVHGVQDWSGDEKRPAVFLKVSAYDSMLEEKISQFSTICYRKFEG